MKSILRAIFGNRNNFSVSKKKKYIESWEQQAFFHILETKYKNIRPYVFAIPNGGFRTEKAGARAKREGLTKGVPDIFVGIPNKNFGGMFIEMKSKTGSLSYEQKSFFKRMNDYYYCFVAKSSKEAIVEIKKYLGMR